MKAVLFSFRTVFFIGAVALCAVVGFAGAAAASTSDGTIDGTDKWAWSESSAWIDFGTSAGNVHVSDSSLTGYAYGENTGWISLNCSNTSSCADNDFAVINDGSGTLSGYAWGANTGWINFAPSGGGVHISASGVFSGTAFGESIGWIVFGTDHPVTTDWRPSSSRGTSSSAPGNGAPLAVRFNYGFVGTSTTLTLLSITPTEPQPAVAQPPTATPPPAPKAPSSPVFLFTRSLTVGATGEDVKALQVFLNAHGAPVASAGAGSSGNETAYFGARTRAAVAVFQKANGIVPPAGYFGPLTRAYITNHY